MLHSALRRLVPLAAVLTAGLLAACAVYPSGYRYSYAYPYGYYGYSYNYPGYGTYVAP
ncbi:MAG: hypothetical protein JO047_10435 [Alphaproteobacteria bacterium]|nr:hypothetical protein [Alphaproteobacteria bacterium]